ncbi:MAG: DUF6429 family protein [Gemmatimonadota bacterium]
MKRAADDSTSIDWEKVNWGSVDDCALALLYFGRHEDYRTWKGFDWEIMNRLHAKGYISDPVGKAKSVVFTDEGLARSAELVRAKFVDR